MKKIIVFLVISMFILGINLWQKTDFPTNSMNIGEYQKMEILPVEQIIPDTSEQFFLNETVQIKINNKGFINISNLEIFYIFYSVSLIFMILSNIVLFYKKTKNKTTIVLNIFCIVSTLMTLIWTSKITLISGYTILLIFSFVCSIVALVSSFNYIDDLSRRSYKTNVVIYYILMISFMIFFIFLN